MTTKTYEIIKREIKQELLQEFVLPILKEVKNMEELKEIKVKKLEKISEKLDKGLGKKFSSHLEFQQYLKSL